MPKKLKISNTNQVVMGLDIGYGVTKAVTDADTVFFPSVAGFARELKFQADEISSKYPGDQIADEDGEWFVGDLALSQVPAGQLLFLRGRTADESNMGNVFRARMARVALGKLLAGRKNGEVVHVRIATGLPVDHMRDAGELKKALLGQHRIHTDSADFIANVTEVMVMPQPYGTIYRNQLKPDGELNECHTARTTGVVDVGTYTTDLALDDDGEYIDARSGSVEAGVSTVQDQVAAAFERDYREKPTYRLVESIIRNGCLNVRGQLVSYQDVVKDAVEPLRAPVLTLMSQKWQTGVGVDVIYLSGGGAEIVAPVVKVAYPQAQIVEDAQLANARGYLNYANFAARED
jgi:plasmid segregation protein ParM